MALPTGLLFTEPRNQPLNTAGNLQPGSMRRFYLTGTTTLATVFTDGLLTNPYSQSPNLITADGFGRFPAIYLDPAIVYRVQLLAQDGVTVLEDIDPYITTAPAGIQSAVKAGSTTRATTTVLAADPDLQINLTATGTYMFDLMLEFLTAGASGATPGVSFDIVFTGTINSSLVAAYTVDGQANASVATAFALATGGNPLSLAGASVANTLHLHGVFTVSAPGVLILNWAQETSSANATVLGAGSAMTTQQIA